MSFATHSIAWVHDLLCFAIGRYESTLIDEIIENVHGNLPKILGVNENIVGMDSRLEKLISLLKIESNDVRMVGVYGLGGIGKTTIINALYNKISYQFESVSLLTDVRKESTENSGLLKLQQQLLNDTLRTKGQIVAFPWLEITCLTKCWPRWL